MLGSRLEWVTLGPKYHARRGIHIASDAPVRPSSCGSLLNCGCGPTPGRTLLGLTSAWTVRPSTREDIASLGIETIAKMDVLASIVSDLGELHLEAA